jgi:HEAT repeat protein
MSRRLGITIVALSLAACGLAIWCPSWHCEPSYRGQRLRFWLEGAAFNDGGQEDAQRAMLACGTNPIPDLLLMVSAVDSPVREFLVRWRVTRGRLEPARALNAAGAYGFRLLGGSASNAVPGLSETYERPRSPDSQKAAAEALAGIGPAAAAAVPALLRGLTNSASGMRGHAVWVLGCIHAQPNLSLPVVLRCLQDTAPDVRQAAAEALGRFGPAAEPAVSDLLVALRDADPSLRMASACALGRIGCLTPALSLGGERQKDSAASARFGAHI